MCVSVEMSMKVMTEEVFLESDACGRSEHDNYVKQANGLSSLFFFSCDENYNTRVHSSKNRKMR